MKKGTAIYAINSVGNLCILIPKLRGDGYVKAPFGGHHANEKYREITHYNDLPIKDIEDCDGYVSVSFSVSRWSDTFTLIIGEVQEHFEKVLPRIKKWEKLSHKEFMEQVMINEGYGKG